MKSPKKIYVFLSNISRGRKACYFAGKLASQIKGMVEVFFIEELSYGQWQQLSDASHDELRNNAAEAIKTMGEIISSHGNRPPVVHYIEPVTKQDAAENLASMIKNTSSKKPVHIAYYITEYKKNDEEYKNIASLISSLPDFAPKIVIPSQITLSQIDDLFPENNNK